MTPLKFWEQNIGLFLYHHKKVQFCISILFDDDAKVKMLTFLSLTKRRCLPTIGLYFGNGINSVCVCVCVFCFIRRILFIGISDILRRIRIYFNLDFTPEITDPDMKLIAKTHGICKQICVSLKIYEIV